MQIANYKIQEFRATLPNVSLIKFLKTSLMLKTY
ncbi:hypothetical protein SDC9_74366 [bioreactor metagenome]|uniref:Uncharacterized protein n=1 Tax=bioreactor metagenome TaxID=1076179 RepID=A0A644YIX9_9ZZZZ